VEGVQAHPQNFDLVKIRAKSLKIWGKSVKTFAKSLKIWASSLKIRTWFDLKKMTSNVV